MTAGSLQDRRHFAQSQLETLARQPGAEHPDALRDIAASVLGFTPVADALSTGQGAVDHAQLPAVATVVGTLANEFGPDYLAVHFDLSAGQSSGQGAGRRDHVTLAQVQAANDLAQRHAGAERYPLLIFTLPDGSGIQFVTGNPMPGNHYRLQDIVRVTAWWNSINRTVLDCLEQAGNGIASGGIPQRAFQGAFNVQPVTEAFFRDYKAAYDAAVQLLQQQLSPADAEQFTQTLFNRLLFVHFVSRKGWLRFNGNADYLNALWRDYQTDAKASNFYASRLTTLFFAGLNNLQSQNVSAGAQPLIGEVPFLNGGLFEETDLDRRAKNAVPDAALAPLLGPGSGDPGLFNRYNFTVMEATPLDTEVAVDPEMLGKLFEETVNERHSSGAYYTPRPVVAFMCREAIKGYLSRQDIAGLDDASIADLVDRRHHDAITPPQALAIAGAMSAMKAVDPACGSGAFLLGMLQEILALNDSLFRAGHTAESLYRQKLDIIANNIYGADKDALAVSTAMLRLWLSLAVDYDGDGPPEPLPNLDLKLAVGDAIAGPDPQQLDFTLQGIVTSGLRDDIAAYTTAHGQRKSTLKRRVEDAKEQLRNQLQGIAPAGVVEWRIDFADVMLGGGFDVVIANPPYVQLQRNGGELGNLYRNVGYTTFARTGDIYQLFYERGCQLLNDTHGILAYITSNSWLKAEYGKKTRRYFAEHHTPFLLLEMGKDVFNEAIVDTSVLLLRHGQQDNRDDLAVQAVDIDHLDDSDFPPPEEHWGSARPNGDAPWSILSKTEQSIMDKMRAVGTPLKEWDIAIYRGITTGLNEAFIIDNRTKEGLVAEDPRSAEILKPVVRGRDIRRYQAEWQSLWLIDAHNGHGDTPVINIDDFPAVKAHLDGYFPRLAKRHDQGTTPYNLRNCAYHADFAKAKLLWADMSPEGRFAYSDQELFCNDKGFIMTGSALKYLCAVLNSSLVTWLMESTALTTGMGVLQWKKFAVERIPIPQISAGRQRPFIRLIERIQAVQGCHTGISKEEAEIDLLVYKMYGLTPDEISLVAKIV